MNLRRLLSSIVKSDTPHHLFGSKKPENAKKNNIFGLSWLGKEREGGVKLSGERRRRRVHRRTTKIKNRRRSGERRRKVAEKNPRWRRGF